MLIVGGNIAGYTRVMTTSIALETSKGDLAARARPRDHAHRAHAGGERGRIRRQPHRRALCRSAVMLDHRPDSTPSILPLKGREAGLRVGERWLLSPDRLRHPRRRADGDPRPQRRGQVALPQDVPRAYSAKRGRRHVERARRRARRAQAARDGVPEARDAAPLRPRQSHARPRRRGRRAGLAARRRGAAPVRASGHCAAPRAAPVGRRAAAPRDRARMGAVAPNCCSSTSRHPSSIPAPRARSRR